MKTSERIKAKHEEVGHRIKVLDGLWTVLTDREAGQRMAARAYRYEQAYKRLRAAQRDWEHYEETGVGCPKGRVW